MALDESKDTKDELQNINSIKILLDNNITKKIDGNTLLTVGFQKTVNGEGFTIDSGDCGSGACESKGCC